MHIAQKQNDLAIKQSELKVQEDTKRAEADAAYTIQQQEQQRSIETATVNAQIAKTEREAELKSKEVEVKKQSLDAEVRAAADADRYRKEQEAQAALYQRQKDAEAVRYEQEQAAGFLDDGPRLLGHGLRLLVDVTHQAARTAVDVVQHVLLAGPDVLQRVHRGSRIGFGRGAGSGFFVLGLVVLFGVGLVVVFLGRFVGQGTSRADEGGHLPAGVSGKGRHEAEDGQQHENGQGTEQAAIHGPPQGKAPAGKGQGHHDIEKPAIAQDVLIEKRSSCKHAAPPGSRRMARLYKPFRARHSELMSQSLSSFLRQDVPASAPRAAVALQRFSPADSGAVGVQLTLSREIQQTAEAVANETMQSGCILVLDTANAKVRACVSRPGYDPENISASLNAPDSPLLERAFQCYAVGSVFKPVVAAAALEAGESGFVYTCPGWCTVDGRIFRCAGGIPHGEVNLVGALEKSCNGYFIRLGQALGADAVRAMAEQLGFGQAIPLTDALHTAAGVLPEREALASSGAYANFCFGQGELLASPLQVAAMMNTIACGGICRTPLLLETTLDETTGAPLTALSHVRSRRVLTKRTAAALQALLAGVVAGGTGHEAALPGQTAAGKTGTAQTGQFSGGTELKNYWFAGFAPAEHPRYTIVVLQDTQAEPAFSSAAIFARVAAGLEILAP